MSTFRSLSAMAIAVASLVLARAPARADEAKPLPDWKDYLAALAPAGDAALGAVYHADSAQDRQDAWNILFGELSRGYLAQVTIDADHPEFVPSYNTGYNIAAPNPDYIYTGTPIDGKGTYRLRGLKGSNLFTFLQFSGVIVDDPKKAAFSLLNHFRLDQLPANRDGTFDILLSAERPKGYAGVWQYMDPRATGVFMRTVAYDWLHERDPVVGIERLDKPAGRQRPTAEAEAAKLQSLVEFVKRDSMTWWRHMQDLQSRVKWNTIGVEPWGTFPGQVYLEGLYRIADDEALVLETAVPGKCLYWSFLVGDMQFRTIDYGHNQASLNGFQARLDRDGKLRLVIARHDPGVPNWLDTAGYNEGVIQGRWNTCDSAPVPTARVVKLADLRASLPADTPLVSPGQRDRTLRDRHLGAQLRRKW